MESAIKNEIEVILNLSSNVIGVYNDENNIAHKLLLSNTQFSKFRKAFANNYSANITLSKTQLHNSTIRIFRWTFRTISKKLIAFNRKHTEPIS